MSIFASFSENSVAAKSGGCFPGSGAATLADGRRKHIKDLKVGDRVLTADEEGNVLSSDFIMFIDHDPTTTRQFIVIETSEPFTKLILTAAHLVFVGNASASSGTTAIFASNVKPGDTVLVSEGTSKSLKRVTVKRIYTEEHEGSYAPVTAHGTIIVDRVLASCYAVIESHKWAHWAFAPVRLSHKLMTWLFPSRDSNVTFQEDGIHWYSNMLFHIGSWLLDRDSFHPLGISHLSWDCSYSITVWASDSNVSLFSVRKALKCSLNNLFVLDHLSLETSYTPIQAWCDRFCA